MEKPVPKQLAHPLAHGDAEALRIKVTLVLLKVMIVACVAFIVSYVASGKFALIPWLAIPFLLPSLALHHLLTKQRKYRYILWFLIYLFTALGLMKLTSAPDYLVDLFLIPTYIGACFLVLRHQHAVPMVVYLLAIYAVAAAVVYRFHPFPILYTNDNLSSVVTGFVLSIIGSTVTFYVFSKSYQQNSDRLSDTLYTLGKVNDDNKLLINVVTHDFRNYLTRLVLLIDICKSKSDDGSTLRELDNLEDAIHKLSELIGDVQTVRDLSSDKARQTTKPVAFGEMLKKIDLIFRHQMVVKQLAFDKAGVQPLTLDVNPDIFTHIILSNLIGNAIKFSPPRDVIELGLEQRPDGPVLTIVNHAPDAHLANLHKIMRGETVESSTPGTHKEQGQGLGLSILKKFCKLYGIDFTLTVVNVPNRALCRVTSTLAFNPGVSPSAHPCAVAPTAARAPDNWHWWRRRSVRQIQGLLHD